MDPGMATISEDQLVTHIKRLASDEFEGRAPSSTGEQKTLTYLQDQFQRLGLLPGNGNSFFQEVPLVKFTSEHAPAMTIHAGTEHLMDLRFKDDMMANTQRLSDSVLLQNSDLVFAGYGIVAPEYSWDDYRDLDVSGKTVVVLVNDPGYPTGNPDVFNGKAMTYYGRWTYKFEEAARQGAAGILIIHETGPAGYPWDVVRNSFGGPQFYMDDQDEDQYRPVIEGWITLTAAQQLLNAAGFDLSELKQQALQHEFKLVPLGITASYSIQNTIEHSSSNNVLAVLPGSEHPDEYIIYTAHWDHFGKEESPDGLRIYNGARDNASGVAALLEIARAFSEASLKPKRSLLFMPVTAEERGLLGSQYYATHPIYPLNQTIAVINMDALNIWGPTRDITVVGYGNSELDDIVEEIAQGQSRRVRPDPEPEKGGFYRMDHFSFAKQGVPALAAEHGVDHEVHGEQWMLDAIEQWTDQHYHKPSDVFDPEYWELSGAVQDTQMYYQIGYQLAMNRSFPNWREGTEFRALRNAMMTTNGE